MEEKTLVRLLLVEDNPGDVRLISEALNLSGLQYQMSGLRDGEEAMRFIRRQPPFGGAEVPDLIILDLNLPCVEGGVLLEAIAAASHLRNVPVVLLSSSRSPMDIARAARIPFGLYIIKPADLDAYLAIGSRVKSFLEGCRQNGNVHSPGGAS